MAKTLKTRIVHKHASEAEWSSSSLIPMQGELIIYDADNNYTYGRFKIGDGVHTVAELPFTTDAIMAQMIATEAYVTNLINQKSQVQIITWEEND